MGFPTDTPVEEHIGLHILHHRLMDLGNVLIIEFIPLPIDHILTIGNVVPAWQTRTGYGDPGHGQWRRAAWSVGHILTACCAMVTNDREEVICGDLRRAFLGQKRA